jgi:hypothetical protein
MAIYWPELQKTENNQWEWTPTAPAKEPELRLKQEQENTDPWKWFAPFSDDDKTRQKVILATQFIDMLQTRDIANNPDKYFEKNPILGEHPSEGDVAKYFVASMLGNYLLSKALPPKLRPYFQNLSIGTQAGMITNNANLGIGLGFKF